MEEFDKGKFEWPYLQEESHRCLYAVLQTQQRGLLK